MHSLVLLTCYFPVSVKLHRSDSDLKLFNKLRKIDGHEMLALGHRLMVRKTKPKILKLLAGMFLCIEGYL